SSSSGRRTSRRSSARRFIHGSPSWRARFSLSSAASGSSLDASVAKDARVTSAISHWLPRFVSNGVLLADFEDVTGSLERWEDWCAAWSKRAAVHEDLGRAALKEGTKLTAGEHLVRAGIYYHFAKFVFVQDLDQMKQAHMKAVE